MWQETKHKQNRFTVAHISQILLRDYSDTSANECPANEFFG